MAIIETLITKTLGLGNPNVSQQTKSNPEMVDFGALPSTQQSGLNSLVSQGLNSLSGTGVLGNIVANSFNNAATRQFISGLPFGGSVAKTGSLAPTVNFTEPSAEFDWRVKLTLPPAAQQALPLTDLLLPLAPHNGVMFPYLPQITHSSEAQYTEQNVIHSNYEFRGYKGSKIDISITNAMFTANTKQEAAYLLAVIHFFRTVTKMFYGNDQNPLIGTPPPVLRLTGLGDKMFKNIPVVVTKFGLDLPNDVDYVSASGTFYPEVSEGAQFIEFGETELGKNRVPSICTMTIGLAPMYSRQGISNQFSLQAFSQGKLSNKGFI